MIMNEKEMFVIYEINIILVLVSTATKEMLNVPPPRAPKNFLHPHYPFVPLFRQSPFHLSLLLLIKPWSSDWYSAIWKAFTLLTGTVY